MLDSIQILNKSCFFFLEHKDSSIWDKDTNTLLSGSSNDSKVLKTFGNFSPHTLLPI